MPAHSPHELPETITRLENEQVSLARKHRALWIWKYRTGVGAECV